MSYSLLHSEFLAVLPEGQVSHATRYCAAKLMAVLERLNNWKRQHYKEDWFFVPLVSLRDRKAPTPVRSLHEELQGEHSRHIISRAIDWLEKLGLLLRRHNPYNQQDRTWQYKVSFDRQHLKPAPGAIASIETLDRPIETLEVQSETLERPIEAMILREQLLEQANKTTDKTESAAEKEAIAQKTEPKTSQPAPVKSESEDGCLPSAAALAELRIEDNPTVRREMKRHADRIEDALAYVKQQHADRWVLRPTGLFITALRQGYKPKAEKPQPQSPAQAAIVLPDPMDAPHKQQEALQALVAIGRIDKVMELLRSPFLRQFRLVGNGLDGYRVEALECN